MTNTIEAGTLREWLEAQQPVTVLDVRSDDDRAQWAIPGSVHINASDWLASESAFAERFTSTLPPTPPNFVRIVELNDAGEFPGGAPTDLEAGANRCAVR